MRNIIFKATSTLILHHHKSAQGWSTSAHLSVDKQTRYLRGWLTKRPCPKGLEESVIQPVNVKTSEYLPPRDKTTKNPGRLENSKFQKKLAQWKELPRKFQALQDT